MAVQIPKDKWILYRHTRDFNLLCEYANLLKAFSKTSISEDDKLALTLKARELGIFKERNTGFPLDSISHYINQLANYMFGYKDGKTKRFIFSPLGNLYLKYCKDTAKAPKIFLTMMWRFQYPHPHAGTSDLCNIHPFRLIFKLLTDKRLNHLLYAYEVAYYVMFYMIISRTSYEELVHKLLALRRMSDTDIERLFKNDRHALVNCIYEWDYYVSKFFEQAGILERTDGQTICKLQQGITNTYRKVTRSWVCIPENLVLFVQKLEKAFPFDEPIINLIDPNTLKIDATKELYNFYPELLLEELGETDPQKKAALELPNLIKKYAQNPDNKTAYLFEDILTDGFNMFYNVDARKIGGAGQTDIECVFLKPQNPKKFAVDAKSTSMKLTGINTSRLKEHRRKMGGDYTIVITSRYIPAAKRDIADSRNVILLANTFAEYLYNCIEYDEREIDYEEFDRIIISHFGNDISEEISKLTISKFSIPKR